MQRIKGEEIARFGILGKQKPKDIFVEGTWDEAKFEGSVAIIGSRKMTDYGRRVLEKLVPGLVGQGKTIVSGFMYGVDMEAHRLTVEYGGVTVAVLGWGMEDEMSNEECRIAKEIVKGGGMMISEWQKQKGALWTFPARNRIVAALCDEVIVIEAAAKSGALITVDMALKLGKPVWAVPGPVTSSVSEGTNRLIASGRAKVYLPENSPTLPLFTKELGVSKIVQLLGDEAMDASEIARRLGEPIEQIGAQLTILVLSGQLVEKGGKYYVG